MMQVKDTTPGVSLPDNCTYTGSSGEGSDKNWAQQSEWVRTLCSISFMGCMFCLSCSYGILSLTDPFGGQQLQYMAVRWGSYIGFYLALVSAYLAMYVGHALPLTLYGWAHGIFGAVGVSLVVAIVGFTSPY